MFANLWTDVPDAPKGITYHPGYNGDVLHDISWQEFGELQSAGITVTTVGFPQSRAQGQFADQGTAEAGEIQDGEHIGLREGSKFFVKTNKEFSQKHIAKANLIDRMPSYDTTLRPGSEARAPVPRDPVAAKNYPVKNQFQMEKNCIDEKRSKQLNAKYPRCRETATNQADQKLICSASEAVISAEMYLYPGADQQPSHVAYRRKAVRFYRSTNVSTEDIAIVNARDVEKFSPQWDRDHERSLNHEIGRPYKYSVIALSDLYMSHVILYYSRTGLHARWVPISHANIAVHGGLDDVTVWLEEDLGVKSRYEIITRDHIIDDGVRVSWLQRRTGEADSELGERAKVIISQSAKIQRDSFGGYGLKIDRIKTFDLMGASTFKNLIALHGVPQAKNIQVAMNYNDPLEGDFTDDTETAAMLVGRSRAACALGGDIFLHVADTVATLSRHLMFHHNGFRTCHIAILLGHIIGPLELSVSTVDKILTSEDKESFPAALYRARVASNSTNYPVRRAGEYVFQRVSAATRFPSVPSLAWQRTVRRLGTPSQDHPWTPSIEIYPID